MCVAARLGHVFLCCVTSQPPAHGDTARSTSIVGDTLLTGDQADVTTGTTTSWSTMTRCRHHARRRQSDCTYITFDMDHPSTPVPICCCERCVGGWFPPEVSARMRSCLLACNAGRLTTEKTCYDGKRRHCARIDDVIHLDDSEKAEMSVMSRDFKCVDLLVYVPFVFCAIANYTMSQNYTCNLAENLTYRTNSFTARKFTKFATKLV